MDRVESVPLDDIDTRLRALGLAAGLMGIPADLARLRHQSGLGAGAFTSVDLIRAGLSLGLKLREVKFRDPAKLTTPTILMRPDGGALLLAKIDAEGALVQDPTETAPRRMSLDELKTIGGRAILVASEASFVATLEKFDLWWIAKLASRHRGPLLDVILASAFVQVVALVSPLLFQVVIDKVLVHRGLSTLDVLAVGMLALALFEMALTALRGYLFAHTGGRIDVQLSALVFQRLMALPLAWFETRRVGDIVARLRELESVRGFLTGSALTLLVDLAFTLLFLVVMAWYSLLLTGVVILTIPLFVGLSLVVTPMLKKRLEEKFGRGADHQAMLVETVSSIETAKSLAIEPQLRRRYETDLSAYARSNFGTGQLNASAGNLVALLSKLSTVALLWLGAHLVIDGRLTVGELIAFNMLAARVAAPILRLAQLFQEFGQIKVSVERLAELMDQPSESTASMSLGRLEGRIRFDRVNFAYGGENPGPEVLSDISIDIPAGQVVGIAGSTGSGKTTLARLIQRLYTPTRGRIAVDGLDLAQIDTAALRRQIGVVPQDGVLFNRSVRENIALADPAMSQEAVTAVAMLAGAHDFIQGLPKGYDTQVGERGMMLSGGQRQRIALARALATDPRILILDEATSALDSEAEREVQANMRRIAEGRTVIVIAHRLSTLRFADRILVLDHGRLVEDGTHSALLAADGRYAQLWRAQTMDLALDVAGARA